METLTSQGQHVVAGLAERHGFSEDAVAHMLVALRHGNGAMAQFDHPEFSGSGQWMRGGMLMLSDMFNHTLKARVDALCNDIAGILANEPQLLQTGSFQSQTQSSGGRQHQGDPVGADATGLFVPESTGQWWPAELGQPNATGSQNHMRYAYFAPARRLAVDVGGRVRVYDTLDHHIGGFSQQQSGSASVVFTSQHGPVELSSLPLVSGAEDEAPPAASSRAAGGAAGITAAGESGAVEDVFAAIERLGELRDADLLTDEEFAEKKADLLRRI